MENWRLRKSGESAGCFGGATPLQFQSAGPALPARGAIFAKVSLPAESKNRCIAVFSPGDFRRNLRKNCEPVAGIGKRFTYRKKTVSNVSKTKPLEMKSHFISSEDFSP
ncbi:MAG: hypothetical protein IK140_10280 [Clostridia bacterium]|nr:hypothetical protein [Clostridia bacterium]